MITSVANSLRKHKERWYTVAIAAVIIVIAVVLNCARQDSLTGEDHKNLQGALTAQNATADFLYSEAPYSTTQIFLSDVQGLWGGRNIHVSATGETTVQTVSRDSEGKRLLWEKRYTLQLNESERKGLVHSLVENDFVTIAVNERPGIPDEAKPLIVLVNSDSQCQRKAKWASDAIERFDNIYQKLLRIEELALQFDPNYEGEYKGTFLSLDSQCK